MTKKDRSKFFALFLSEEKKSQKEADCVIWYRDWIARRQEMADSQSPAALLRAVEPRMDVDSNSTSVTFPLIFSLVLWTVDLVHERLLQQNAINLQCTFFPGCNNKKKKQACME